MQLAEQFATLVKQREEFSKHDRVLVAVSGGVDSIVLLDLLQRLPVAYRPQLAIAHVDHQLRSSSSDEKVFVEEISHTLGYPFYSFTWKKEEHPHSGIEKAAREQRYQFFSKIMQENNLNKLVTGHHKDDQAETVLMRIVRGTALEYLTGIKRLRSFDGKIVVRPLLDFTKSTLYQYAQSNQLTYVEDETNQQSAYTRNRYRNEILPLLKKENEAVVAHLSELSKEVSDVWAIAQPIIEARVQECATVEQSVADIDTTIFLTEAVGMQRQMLKMILNQLYQGSNGMYKQKHIELIIDWLNQSGPNSTLDLPGHYQAVKHYQNLLIQKKRASQQKRITHPQYLNSGEWIVLPDNKRLGLFPSNKVSKTYNDSKKIVIEKDAVALPLKVRNRQDGDRIRPLGMNGTKKVKKLLIDKKIPIDKRDELILIEDATGELLWIVDVQESRLSIDAKPDKMHYVLLLEET